MSTITPQGQKLLRQVTSYKYFVSYFTSSLNRSGFGNIDITTAQPIRGREDLVLIAKEIKRLDKTIKDVVIINWILL